MLNFVIEVDCLHSEHILTSSQAFYHPSEIRIINHGVFPERNLGER